MKAFWKSKTLWANALVIGLHFAKPVIGGTLGVDVSTVPDASPEVIAVGNILLRLITNKGIAVTQ